MFTQLSRYIDPGTGSMLFTLFIGVVSTAYFSLRQLAIKMKFAASGGTAKGSVPTDKLPYVIFTDGKQYWNVFKPICDEFESRGIDVAYWTASPDDPALNEPYRHVKAEFIGEENKAFARLNLMSAMVCLATTPGLDVYQWKRSKDVDWYVHTFHTVGTALGYRMFGMDYYDSVLLAGEYQVDEIRTIEDVRNLPHKELVTVGSTYLDAMASRLQREGDRRYHRGISVLLAPSWGPNAILTVYGERLIDAILDAGFALTIRPHPQSRTSDSEVLERLMKKYPDGQRVSWNFDNDNFECLAEADVMITDFSGVIFDYALVFDRPVIYTPANYDSSLYDAAWYDKPQWRFETYPTFGVPLSEDQFPHMRQVIEAVIADEGLAAGRARAREEAWACPGRAAKLTVDYLVAKHAQLTGQPSPVTPPPAHGEDGEVAPRHIAFVPEEDEETEAAESQAGSTISLHIPKVEEAPQEVSSDEVEPAEVPPASEADAEEGEDTPVGGDEQPEDGDSSDAEDGAQGENGDSADAAGDEQAEGDEQTEDENVVQGDDELPEDDGDSSAGAGDDEPKEDESQEDESAGDGSEGDDQAASDDAPDDLTKALSIALQNLPAEGSQAVVNITIPLEAAYHFADELHSLTMGIGMLSKEVEMLREDIALSHEPAQPAPIPVQNEAAEPKQQ